MRNHTWNLMIAAGARQREEFRRRLLMRAMRIVVRALISNVGLAQTTARPK